MISVQQKLIDAYRVGIRLQDDGNGVRLKCDKELLATPEADWLKRIAKDIGKDKLGIAAQRLDAKRLRMWELFASTDLSEQEKEELDPLAKLFGIEYEISRIAIKPI